MRWHPRALDQGNLKNASTLHFSPSKSSYHIYVTASNGWCNQCIKIGLDAFVLCFAHYSIPPHSCLAITLSKFTDYHVCSSLQGCTLVDTHKICFIVCFTIALQKCKYSLQIKDYNVGPILWKNYDCHDWFTVFCCATIILILWPGNEAMETGRYNMKLTTTTQVWIVLAIIFKHNSHMFSECIYCSKIMPA